MPTIYTTTKIAGTGADGGGPSAWSNPTRITADDGSNTTWVASGGGDTSNVLKASNFSLNIPTDAVIDGVVVTIDGSGFSAYTNQIQITTNTLTGENKADSGSLLTSYGAEDDLWNLSLTPAIVNGSDFCVNIGIGDVSGGDATGTIDYISVTIFWHYDVTVNPTEVPIRHLYKVYSKDDVFLGNLKKVISPFGFSEEINVTGSQLSIEVGLSADTSGLANDRIVTEDGDPITDEDGNYLRTERAASTIAQGTSTENTLIKNGNRIVVYEFNYWHPNGKAMFSGQINRIEAGFGGEGSSETIKLLVLSDGLDFDNYIARGAPFSYTNDQVQTSQNGRVTLTTYSGSGGWERYGQTVVIGAGVTNVGAFSLMLDGIATVTVSMYEDASASTVLASVTKNVAVGTPTAIEFAFPALLSATAGTTKFFAASVSEGQSIWLHYSNANPYASGQMYWSSYAGAGGGSYNAVAGSDLYFITKYGVPTTTATYSSKDPITGMFSPILADYNARGGRITERNFDATGLSLTYTFNTNTILDARNACLAMSPNGFYTYIDLGTNEMDFKEISATADYVMIKGRHLHALDLILSIENIKNQLLFSGGETAGVNLYRQYQDTTSMEAYGVRLERRSDNRVTVSGTADAIGHSFIPENKDEQNHTTIQVGYSSMDISLLTPGKVIGFSGFGTFIDNILIQIVRRQYTSESVTLSLGILPKRTSAVYESITRGLLAEQTVANPSAPS